ncbi:MAG: FeoB-associated Cys-rich membrane protein [Krumholzibacteria bacterium]|nr:FeoB-associated Cys-rich membrane protein [Candidatus Krumholzibacteria bacterium]
MAFTWETVVVVAIVGAALVWAGRSLWKAGRKKQVCSTCGSAGSCPLVSGTRDLTADGAACGAVPDPGTPATPPARR